MIRAFIILSSLIVFITSPALAQLSEEDDDHRGSGRATQTVQCLEGRKYRNSECVPI